MIQGVPDLWIPDICRSRTKGHVETGEGVLEVDGRDLSLFFGFYFSLMFWSAVVSLRISRSFRV